MIPNPSYSCLSNHNLFQKENGDVYSFGSNNRGQCGIKEQYDISESTLIMNNPNIIFLTAGEQSSFYIEKNGDLYGCGSNESGKLGLGKEIDTSAEFVFICSDVKLIHNATKFTVMQKTDGKIFWRGIMGSLESTESFEEIKMDDVVSFTCGYEFTLFLKGKGEVWAMGSNEKGQCGFKEETLKLDTPTLLFADKNIISVSCGYDYSFILTRDEKGDTVLKCFGCNEFGELGLGHTDVKYGIDSISTFPNISSVHCGSGHSLILTMEGDVYGCGFNHYGQIPLEENFLTNNTIFTKTLVSDITHITTGFNHSIFINKNKEIFICGGGSQGQMGVDRNDKNELTKFIFDDLKLLQGHQFFVEWSIKHHKLFGKEFKEGVFIFLLCLKNSKQLLSKNIKLPKPIQHIIIKFSF